MLTIADALNLAIFKDAKLVAGAKGINNTIRWVHIVSMPESGEYKWTKGHELILTVGLGLRENQQKQRELIPKLSELNIAGLVLSIGHYFEHAPDIIVQEANRLGFPIIELPGDVPFVEVTEAIFTHIMNEQYATLQRAQAIHKTLMDIVLSGGSLQNLTEALSNLLDKSITIESVSYDVLADAQRGSVDPARQRTLDSGHTSPEVIQFLQHIQLNKRLLEEGTAIYIEPRPEMGMELERIVAPILVGKKILGYMWIVANSGELTDLDTVAIEQSATVAALLMYKERAVLESKRAIRGDFFSQLLRSEAYSQSELESQAAIFDFRLNRHYQVMIVEYDSQDENIDSSFVLSRVESLVKEQLQAMVVVREQRIVIIPQVHQSVPDKRIAELIFDSLKPMVKEVLVGIGKLTDSVHGISDSYEQALEALTIARSMEQANGIFSFDELGLLHWLHQLPEAALEENVYYRALSELDNYDSDQNKQLFETLEAYLEFGGRMKEAADSLFVHRNTLTYRLERIEELIGLDLREANHQINLYVALKTYQLRKKQPPFVNGAQ